MIRRYFEAKRLRPQKNVATMLDLRGREIRVGKCPPEGVKVEVGHISRVTFVGYVVSKVSSDDVIVIDTTDAYKVLKGGDKINFENGKIEAQVLEVLNQEIKVKFLEEGVITQHSKMGIPGIRLKELPILKYDDESDLNQIAVK